MTANTIETGGTENLFAYFLDWLVLSLNEFEVVQVYTKTDLS